MMMMTTTQVRVHLRATLRQVVPAIVIKCLQADIVQEVHQAEVQAPHLEAIRHLQAEETAAVLRQEVLDHITGQAEENQGIKILV